MFWLLASTLIWSFSFSFISEYLSGQIDSWFAVMIRIAFAFFLFFPFIFKSKIPLKVIMQCSVIGMLQLGIMYVFYYNSFRYVTVTEVLLFTCITPIYITLIYDILAKRSLRISYLFSALLAVIGAAVIRFEQPISNFWIGFLMIQIANFSFALGLVLYKRLMEVVVVPQHQAFAWFYLGAFCFSSTAWLIWGAPLPYQISSIQWSVLAWLGFIASGMGYFMWNYGSTKVDSGTVAIMNNAIVPIGIAVNLLFWNGESINWIRLLIGGVILLSSLVIHRFWIVKKEQANTE